MSRFRQLHESGCLVIPNPWDTGTARYLKHLGFPALATSSAGTSFNRAYDGTLGEGGGEARVEDEAVGKLDGLAHTEG